MILKYFLIILNIRIKKNFTSVNVDASTNSCELSEISVKPTSSLVKIIHWRSSYLIVILKKNKE